MRKPTLREQRGAEPCIDFCDFVVLLYPSNKSKIFLKPRVGARAAFPLYFFIIIFIFLKAVSCFVCGPPARSVSFVFIFIFLAVSRSMWDLSSPTRDRTRIPGIGSAES